MRTQARRPLFSLIAVLLVLLGATFALGGCSSEFNVSLGDAEDEVQTYTEPTYGYSFDYPSDWQLQESGSGQAASGLSAEGSVTALDPDGAIAGDYAIDLVEVSVYKLPITVDESTMPDMKAELERLLAEFESQDATWKTVAALSEITVGGLKGYKATVTYDMDGTPTTATLHFLFDGSMEYELMVQAATANWEGDQAVFAAVLASFRPGTNATETSQ